MYAIELDGRHIGLTLHGKKLGTKQGKRVIRDILIKTIYKIEHTGTRVKVEERKRIKSKWGGYYYDHKTTNFALNDEVEIEEENDNY